MHPYYDDYLRPLPQPEKPTMEGLAALVAKLRALVDEFDAFTLTPLAPGELDPKD